MGIWELDRAHVLAATFVLLLQAVLIAVLLVQRKRRLRAERSRIEAAERLSLATRSAALGIWQWKVGTGEVECSAECKRMLGFLAEARVSQGAFLGRVHPSEREAVETALDEALLGLGPCDVQFRVILPGGETRWVAARGNGHRNAGGPSEIVGIMMDVTGRKLIETELQRSRQALAHITRVSTMGELATSLAHELNQPLTAILSNAQAAQRFLATSPANVGEVREILREIVHDDSRAGEVIRRIRILTKKEDLVFRELDVEALIREVVMVVRADAALRNVRIVLELAPGMAAIRGDKVQIQQVLLNLLLNAFDAMAGCPLDAREVAVTACNEDAAVKIAVRDRGTGFTKGQLERAFEPFFSTKPEGMGMGLSITRSIVESHGGWIWAGNNDDAGATFTFIVPAGGGS